MAVANFLEPPRSTGEAGILILPVVYVIYRSYRLYLSQLQKERDRAEEVQKHAAEIEVLCINRRSKPWPPR